MQQQTHRHNLMDLSAAELAAAIKRNTLSLYFQHLLSEAEDGNTDALDRLREAHAALCPAAAAGGAEHQPPAAAATASQAPGRLRRAHVALCPAETASGAEQPPAAVATASQASATTTSRRKR